MLDNADRTMRDALLAATRMEVTCYLILITISSHALLVATRMEVRYLVITPV